MKKFISVLLSLLMVFSLFTVSSFAEGSSPEEPKKEYSYKAEEVIYGVLGADGDISKIMPVVILDTDKDTALSYYGDFKEVKNLTDTSKLKAEKGELKLNIPKGRFYFEAQLKSQQIPWLVDINYKLDGKDISPEKLGGKSGELQIEIGIKANEKADKSFFDAYLMQISVTLSSDKCKNIKAEGATMANAGANKMINFMSMPGTESEFLITADVSDFAMGGMSIAAVPISMADMLGSMDGIEEGIEEFTGAMDELSSGVSQLNDGAVMLSQGMAMFANGLMELSANSQPLRDAAEMMLGGLRALDEALGALQNGDIDIGGLGLNVLPETLRTIAGTVSATADSIDAEQQNIISAVDNMNGAFLADRSGLDEQGLAYVQNLEASWASSAAALLSTASDLELAEQSVRGMADSLYATADTIEAIINSQGGGDISAQLGKIRELVEGFEMFYDGIIQYTQGVDMLADNSVALSDGVNGIAGGTSMLNSGTSQIPGQMEQMMDEMGGADFEPHSFISEKNENVSAVQFVFSTEAISAPEEFAEESDNTQQLSGVQLFFSKLKALFKSDES